MQMKQFLRSLLIATLLFPATAQLASGQNVGVSFSFFFPKNGYFSIPISPFSLRGVGINLNRYVALESGFSLYRMSGLSVTDVPFETKDPILGPTTTLLVPAELVLQVGNSSQQFRVKGGVFAFYNLSSRLMSGNLDKALKEYVMWDVLNSDYTYENNLGWGYQLGAEYIVYITKQFGITLGANYFFGGADLNLEGSYSGGLSGGTLQTAIEDFPDSKLDFTGWEISLGALFGN
jgi:hypothetical protein